MSASAKGTGDGGGVDPVLMQIIGGELDSVAKEMAHQLIRSSYSVLIRESEDMGCALLNTRCEEIAESDNTPFHVGSLVAYTGGAMETIEERGIELEPGDVMIHNHPYLGASHSLDIGVIVPIFWEGELFGFSANTAHHLDIGGAQPGGTIDLFDMYAEGRIFNANFLYKAGVRDDNMWNFFSDNTRAPREVIGDLSCQVAAARHGDRRMIELLHKHGRETIETYSNALIDYSERMLRAEIEKVPDGTYEAEGWLDDDGIHRDQPERINVKVVVEGSSVTVDLTESPPQHANALNTPYGGSTCVGVYSLFRTLLLDTFLADKYIPANSGGFRPITVIAPEGTIFNPKFPAATQIRFNPINRVADLILQALAPVMPDRATAGNSAQLNGMYMSGTYPDGSYWITIEVDEGSYGGRPGKDGMDAVDCLSANIRNQPIEDLELHLPFRFHRYELIEREFGHGTYRGGTSAVRDYAFLTPAQVTTESERHAEIDPPPGVFGGTPGRPGRFWHVREDGSEERLYSKVNAHRFEPGDRLVIEGVTSGGYGDPLERDPALVLDNALDELISTEQAREIYGVVIDGREVDAAATETLRTQMRTSPARARES
ncbi:MAG: hydantoinase B/oxoprolinase family protein [Candidatus Deferrimicrobiaceae bacterium]